MMRRYFVYHSTDEDPDYTNHIMREIDPGPESACGQFCIGRIVDRKNFILDWWIDELFDHSQILKDAYETN